MSNWQKSSTVPTSSYSFPYFFASPLGSFSTTTVVGYFGFYCFGFSSLGLCSFSLSAFLALPPFSTPSFFV
jgi:hypothetical protein